MKTLPTPQPLSTKKIGLVLAGIVALGVIIAGTVMLLKAVMPSRTTDQANSASLSPSQVIEQYSKPNAIAALGATIYDKQLTYDKPTHITYRSADHNFSVATATDYQLLFYAKNADQKDDHDTVQKQTTEFLTGKGYALQTSDGNVEEIAFTTYDSQAAICQLSSGQPAVGQATMLAYHQLACVDKTAIGSEYEAIDQLLGLYKKTGQTPVFTQAVRDLKTDSNKAMATLSLTSDKASTFLLFAAIDGQWEYIGNLSGGSESAKYVISAEVRQAMSAAKYGDFLTKNLPQPRLSSSTSKERPRP